MICIMSLSRSPKLSSSATLVNAQLVLSLVAYLIPYPEFGVLLCSEHRCCYTTRNYQEHLLRQHGVKGPLKKKIESWVKAQNIPDQVRQPSHYRPPLPGLSILSGWKCNVGDCIELSQSEEILQRHYSAKHHLRSKPQQRAGSAYSEVKIQVLFAQSKQYFIVDPRLQPQRHASANHSSLP